MEMRRVFNTGQSRASPGELQLMRDMLGLIMNLCILKMLLAWATRAILRLVRPDDLSQAGIQLRLTTNPLDRTIAVRQHTNNGDIKNTQDKITRNLMDIIRQDHKDHKDTILIARTWQNNLMDTVPAIPTFILTRFHRSQLDNRRLGLIVKSDRQKSDLYQERYCIVRKE